MPKTKETVTVQGTEIAALTHRQGDYTYLTDMTKHKNAEILGTVISHWMSTVFSISYMGLWKKINNSDKCGNMRDHTTSEQLVVLSNTESINALLVRQ